MQGTFQGLLQKFFSHCCDSRIVWWPKPNYWCQLSVLIHVVGFWLVVVCLLRLSWFPSRKCPGRSAGFGCWDWLGVFGRGLTVISLAVLLLVLLE
jgi:hypothetical protein